MNGTIARLTTMTLLCGSMAVANVSAQTRSVSVRLDGPVFALQENSNLCWAATISNLFAYHGFDVGQQRIVAEVYGAPSNMRSGDYSNLARLLNREWSDDTGRAFRSSLSAAMDLRNGVMAITNDTMRDALAGNRPLVMGTTDHAMLIVGMRFVEIGGRVGQVIGVDVFDPWPGRGFRTALPSEVTPVPLGGKLMFVAEARISSSTLRSRRDRLSTPNPATTQMGRSCQTPVGRCGPFYNQPALPVGSPCYCATVTGPVTGGVVQ